MRALRFLLRVLLRALQSISAADCYEVLATWALIAMVHELGQPGHGHALSYLVFYLLCRGRANGSPPSPICK